MSFFPIIFKVVNAEDAVDLERPIDRARLEAFFRSLCETLPVTLTFFTAHPGVGIDMEIRDKNPEAFSDPFNLATAMTDVVPEISEFGVRLDVRGLIEELPPGQHSILIPWGAILAVTNDRGYAWYNLPAIHLLMHRKQALQQTPEPHLVH